MANTVDDLPVVTQSAPKPDMTPLNAGLRETAPDKEGKTYPYVQGAAEGTVDALPVVEAGKNKLPQPMSGETHDAIATNGTYSDILKAFGQGFAHEWGTAQFGPELKKTMEDAGILYTGEKGSITIGQAFNEAFIRPAANALDVGLRTLTGTIRGFGDAAVEGGAPKDFVAMTLENPMFAGGPGLMGRMPRYPGGKPRFTGGTDAPVDLRVAKDLNVIGPVAERSPLAEGTPAEAAKAAVQPITAYHGSPRSFEAYVGEQSSELSLEPPKEGNFYQVRVHADGMDEFNKLSPPEKTQAIEVTHRNGEPVSRPVPAERTDTNDLVKRSETLPANPIDANPWQARFDEWVSKLEVADDVKRLIREASKENNTFEEARKGQIPAAHLGALSGITGIPVEFLPESKMRQTMKNDAEFRTAAQLMIKTNDDVFTAARNHKAEGSFESRKELTAALMRRDLALEGVLGLRAEWGRTGNVMQEFLRDVKDAQGLGKFIKGKKGDTWDSSKLDEIANQLGSLNSREAVGRYLTEMRKPDFLDKLIWYWTNSILSGPITHAKYIAANAAYLAHDTLIATPAAGVSGAVRQLLSKEQVERVYMGEAVAKVYGLIAGVPDAVRASVEAARNGIPTPLPAQMKGAGVTNPVTGLRPVEGKVGAVIGAPSNVISGIHSFYNFLGYRSELEALAYRKAIKMGYSPVNRDFWPVHRDLVNFPDDAMMDAAIHAGQRANFVQDLGPTGTAVQAMLYKTRIGRFVMPFIKVPGNIVNAMQEGTPMAFVDARMRGDLLGKNGAAARDTAIGRMAAGSSVMGWAAYQTLGDQITGNGPIDPKQRAEWLLTHQPRSYRFGDVWKSYDRFGPIGGWLSLAADLTDATKAGFSAFDQDRVTETQQRKFSADLAEAAARVVHGFVVWVEEGGYQGLFNIVETLENPNKTHASNAGALASTMLPFSALQSQGASFMDKNQRDAKTFIEGFQSRIPILREDIRPQRDWTGAPVENPLYHSMVKNRSVNTDSVDYEMQRLDIKPTKPADAIHGVKLTADQYNEFQTQAGTITRMALHALVDQPSWQTFGDFAKGRVIDRTIKASRAQAEAYMQMKYPQLVQEGIDTKNNLILGPGKPKATAFPRP